jgi:cation diffusion facilitator family transporter
MHTHSIDGWTHQHVFLGNEHARNERRSWIVIALCGVMMLAETFGGIVFGSMALIADGLHMSTHTGALLIAAVAYTYARRHSDDERFAFGTGKLGDLAAFSSAIALAMIALLIGYEAVTRLFRPVSIEFDEAIPIAALGMGVNLLSAWLLREEHDHGVRHTHALEHDDHAHGSLHSPEHHRDLNLRAAYIHVVADAAVSVLAVVGLLTARELGWVWMDPLMGVVGALVIANWSWALVRAAGAVLLDMRAHPALAQAIRERLETMEGDRISDLHLWRVGPGHNAAIVSLVSDHPQMPRSYKERLIGLVGLSHITIEVEACPHERI